MRTRSREQHEAHKKIIRDSIEVDGERHFAEAHSGEIRFSSRTLFLNSRAKALFEVRNSASRHAHSRHAHLHGEASSAQGTDVIAKLGAEQPQGLVLK